MCMQMGMTFQLAHAILLLAVSFFIMVAARKNDSQGLKTFGYVIAVLLWICAALVLGRGLSARRYMMYKKCPMMGVKSGRPMPGMDISPSDQSTQSK
jgi:low temperature requirement protein LtrA